MTIFFATSLLDDVEHCDRYKITSSNNPLHFDSKWTNSCIDVGEDRNPFRITIPSELFDVWMAFTVYVENDDASFVSGNLKLDNSSDPFTSTIETWNNFSSGHGRMIWQGKGLRGSSNMGITHVQQSMIDKSWKINEPNRIVIHYKPNSENSSNGKIEIWVNSVKVLSYSGDVMNSDPIDTIYVSRINTKKKSRNYFSEIIVADEDLRGTRVETIELSDTGRYSEWEKDESGALHSPGHCSIQTSEVVSNISNSERYTPIHLQISLKSEDPVDINQYLSPYIVFDKIEYDEQIKFSINKSRPVHTGINRPSVYYGYPQRPYDENAWSREDFKNMEIGFKSTDNE